MTLHLENFDGRPSTPVNTHYVPRPLRAQHHFVLLILIFEFRIGILKSSDSASVYRNAAGPQNEGESGDALEYRSKGPRFLFRNKSELN